MLPIWMGVLIAASGAISLANVAHAQSTDSAKNDYIRSCAACHGETGKGDGPKAKAFKMPPADLTKLAKSNKGVFPISRVYNVIDGRIEVLTHGSRDMPVWGDIYGRELTVRAPPGMSKEMGEVLVAERILGLIEYISTLQEK